MSEGLTGLKAEDLKEIEKRLQEAKEKASEFIRTYPLTSVAIGVSVGYFLSKLFSRK
ncbi:MAG: hypothetical protein Q7U04_09935 [Bacteriovorax sp.]|nr:hypothetical protein [Bacteriovorax sp.]